MAEDLTPSPENTIANGDPGDETAKRYRYQWTWAAVVCCMLLDDTCDIDEVFCEQHEDVLLKHHDGLFTGHQIKTRQDDQPAWKAIDEDVISACVRFVKLDERYPQMFRKFYFLTNHSLYSSKNGHDLSYILQTIKQSTSIASLPGPVAKWVKRVASEAEVPETAAFATLSKTEATADLPKLRDATVRLINTLDQCWDAAKDCTYDGVKRAAIALIDECGRASSLDYEQLLPAYIVPTAIDEANLERINGKRMTLSRVKEILESGRDSVANLAGDPSNFIEPGQGSTELLHKKLDAGGFSAVSRNSADDLRNKADYLGLKWIEKYGHDKGLERYDHILSIVLNDAGRAFDATKNDGDRFGPAMREDLRRRLRERRLAGEQLYDCTDDHLEGVAFSLSAQCKIVWSNNRPWEIE